MTECEEEIGWKEVRLRRHETLGIMTRDESNRCGLQLEVGLSRATKLQSQAPMPMWFRMPENF
jgi:hypothetical protein